jgi:hypothetical protein
MSQENVELFRKGNSGVECRRAGPASGDPVAAWQSVRLRDDAARSGLEAP